MVLNRYFPLTQHKKQLVKTADDLLRIRIGRLYLETIHKELFEKRVTRWYNVKEPRKWKA